jgi:hypothetical protein
VKIIYHDYNKKTIIFKNNLPFEKWLPLSRL